MITRPDLTLLGEDDRNISGTLFRWPRTREGGYFDLADDVGPGRANRRDEVDRHHDARAAGKPGILVDRAPAPRFRPLPGLPAVPADVAAANERTVDYLRTVAGLGDLSHSHLLRGHIDEALATGQSNINSDGTFTAVRNGDVIQIDGVVTHTWEDRYDFEKGKSGAEMPLKAVEGGKAKFYDIRSSWRQRVGGSFRIKNGRLSNPVLVWQDINPKGSRP